MEKDKNWRKKSKNRKTADIFYWKFINSRNWWTKYLGRGGENWTEPKKKMEKIKFSQMVMEERWMRILTIHILGLGSAQWASLQCQQINCLKSQLAQMLIISTVSISNRFFTPWSNHVYSYASLNYLALWHFNQSC